MEQNDNFKQPIHEMNQTPIGFRDDSTHESTQDFCWIAQAFVSPLELASGDSRSAGGAERM